MTTPPEPISAEDEIDWYFTFGAGQFLFAGHRDGVDMHSFTIGGLPLDNYYVVINGTFKAARERMHSIFGALWCDQYPSLEVFAPYYPQPPVRLPIQISG